MVLAFKNVVVFNQNLFDEIRVKCDVTKPLKDDATLDSLAYVVYSSGTTGKPKG